MTASNMHFGWVTCLHSEAASMNKIVIEVIADKHCDSVLVLGQLTFYN